ncbi:hypothetical protein ACTFIR_010886 [Dictyostelium discoideum]
MDDSFRYKKKLKIEKFSSFGKIDYKNPFEKVQIDAIKRIPAYFSGSISNIKIDLIKEVILSDDIELVKMVFESLPSPTCNTSVIELIKSPLMFDCIKNQLEKLSRPSENSLYFDQIISNYKIPNHFKNNYYQ